MIKLHKGETALTRFDAPAKIFGDIHGQWFDMMQVLPSLAHPHPFAIHIPP